jgi:hypothetical protein
LVNAAILTKPPFKLGAPVYVFVPVNVVVPVPTFTIDPVPVIVPAYVVFSLFPPNVSKLFPNVIVPPVTPAPEIDPTVYVKPLPERFNGTPAVFAKFTGFWLLPKDAAVGAVSVPPEI